MKKISLSFLLIVLILIGCSKYEEIKSSSYESAPVFTAIFENAVIDVPTKTYLDENIKILWNKKDELSIFTTTLNERYVFDGETGDNSGSFTKIKSEDFGAGNDITTNYAVYPYDKDNKIQNDESFLTVPLRDNQTYFYGSVGIGANVAVAITNGLDDFLLKFKNACSYIQIRLYGEQNPIESITMQGLNNEKLSGIAKIKINSAKEPIVSLSDDANAVGSITLMCGDEGVKIGSTKDEATSFWIALPPTTFSKGLTLTITDIAGNQMVKKYSSSFDFSRNVYKRATFEFIPTHNINKEKERNALMALYNSLGGDGWRNNSNWCSESPVGDWDGVSVDEEGFVVELNLRNNNLKGELPVEIGDFSRLVSLDMGSDVNGGKGDANENKNSIEGTLPESICKLASLMYLDLSNNHFQGTLPENLGNLSRMENLRLSDNQFTGDIPESVWTGMSKLTSCVLNNNEFTGGLTSSIGKCLSLQHLDISGNNFSSPIPAEICNLWRLQILALTNSGVTGRIPEKIGYLKYLESFRAGGNNLSGSIPESICNLGNLTVLELDGNSLRGEIPNLGLLASAQIISLENNMLEGQIPETIGKCANLLSLDVSNNRLTGSIPSAISRCTQLQILNAYSNRLDGVLPKTLGDCSELRNLRLNDNKLSGEIPASMEKMTKLVLLHLNSNQLSGNVIDFSQLSSLKELLLASNSELGGEISAEVLDRLNRYSIEGTKINVGSGGGLQNPEIGGEDLPWE